MRYAGELVVDALRTSAELFCSLALMGLCHGLVEDILIMMLQGGHLSGLLWGRLVFSLLVIFLLGKLIQGLPALVCGRDLFHPGSIIAQTAEKGI